MPHVKNARALPNVVVSPYGHIRFRVDKPTYRAGFAALLDLNPAHVTLGHLPQGEPTRLSFLRIGQALANAIRKRRA